MEELLTVKEVAEKMKCSPKHIYSLIKRGKFPAQVKIGGSSRWKSSDIKSWFENLGIQGGQAI